MRKLTLLLFLLAPLLAACRSSILDDPSTVIPYALPEPSHVTITIENSYNTVVATLVDADLSAGTHNVSYKIRGLQEGIYFYTLDVRNLKTGVHTRDTHFLFLIK